MSTRPTLKRHRAGLYSTLGESHYIIRTSYHEGPRGGCHDLWEHAYPERRYEGGKLSHEELIIDGLFCEGTLREAHERLTEALAREQDERVAASCAG